MFYVQVVIQGLIFWQMCHLDLIYCSFMEFASELYKTLLWGLVGCLRPIVVWPKFWQNSIWKGCNVAKIGTPTPLQADLFKYVFFHTSEITHYNNRSGQPCLTLLVLSVFTILEIHVIFSGQQCVTGLWRAFWKLQMPVKGHVLENNHHVNSSHWPPSPV